MRVFLTTCVLGLALLGARSACAQPPVQSVHLAFDSSWNPGPSARTAAIAEAALLWKPYGVRVYEGAADSCDPSLIIMNNADDVDAHAGGELGSVRFGPDGVPDSRIQLHYAAVVQLATGSDVFRTVLREWPMRRLRDEIIARAVGRTLAHEIGHYVLRWPHHAASGLMQPRHRASALASPARSGFGLTSIDVARLGIVRAASGVGTCHPASQSASRTP